MAEKLSEKEALRNWENFVDNIRKTTALLTNETEEQQKKRIKYLEADFEEWVRYYFPKYAYAAPADFHTESSKRVLNNPEWVEVRIWSRELAKSVRTMMEVLYLILTKKKKFVLLVSNSLGNAVRLLMPYRANLQGNQRIINDYGLQQKEGSWSDEEFITQGGVAFRALGAGQSPRGARNEEVRPDVLLFDDMDTDEECRNPDLVKVKWKWIEDAAIGTRSISEPMLIIFNGNRIAVDCCMERAMKIADKVSEVNICDKAGKSTWPAKNSQEAIERVLSQKSYASAQKEYYNNPITEGSVFKDMAYKPARPMSEYSLLVCYTDPSFKESKKNDFKATVLVGKWRDEFHIIKCYLEQTITAKMVEWCYSIMEMVGSCACYYYMEQVFLQDILLQEYYSQGAIKGKTIPIAGDQRQKPDKFTRIESLLEPLNRNGKLFLNEREKPVPHMQRLYDQFLALAPGSRAHEDGPDAVEGAVWMLNNKVAGLNADSILTGRKINNNKKY
ncbi:MAG: hypothetical protein H0X33_14525 [Taibaiella sp.]|nr:hypothetical protein [Taibaiella sp.]